MVTESPGVSVPMLTETVPPAPLMTGAEDSRGAEAVAAPVLSAGAEAVAVAPASVVVRCGAMTIGDVVRVPTGATATFCVVVCVEGDADSVVVGGVNLPREPPSSEGAVVGSVQGAGPPEKLPAVALRSSKTDTAVAAGLRLLFLMKVATAAMVPLGVKPGRRMDEFVPLTPTRMSLELAGSPVLKSLPVMAAHTSMSSAVRGAPAASPMPAAAPEPGLSVTLPVMVRLT